MPRQDHTTLRLLRPLVDSSKKEILVIQSVYKTFEDPCNYATRPSRDETNLLHKQYNSALRTSTETGWTDTVAYPVVPINDNL